MLPMTLSWLVGVVVPKPIGPVEGQGEVLGAVEEGGRDTSGIATLDVERLAAVSPRD